MAKPVEQTDGIPIYCAHDAMVATSVLEGNPRNPNRHPDDQIRLLAKIIVTQGWRAPITVSKRSGQIVRGHGRLLAAQAAGLTFCPVDYQDYESDEAEYADLVADNRLAELAELDRPTLKDLLQDLDTGALDMELTGFTEDALAELMSEFHLEDGSGAGTEDIPEQFMVLIECQDETMQVAVLERLNAEGYKCRALVS